MSCNFPESMVDSFDTEEFHAALSERPSFPGLLHPQFLEKLAPFYLHTLPIILRQIRTFGEDPAKIQDADPEDRLGIMNGTMQERFRSVVV